MKNNYFSVSKIARELNLDRRTMAKYLNPATTGINSHLGSKRKSNLDPYLLFINNMVDLGATSTKSLKKLKAKVILVHCLILDITYPKEKIC